jgi:hypothetical protein
MWMAQHQETMTISCIDPEFTVNSLLFTDNFRRFLAPTRVYAGARLFWPRRFEEFAVIFTVSSEFAMVAIF